MKTLMCSLAAILTVALSSAGFAAEDDGWITGTVVRLTKDGDFVIDEGKRGGESNFEITPAYIQMPRVGEKVKVHYYHCGSGRKGFHHCADKIEKLGNTEGGSKNR
jgi:hypothetical protein